MAKQTLIVKGIKITIDDGKFVSITDIAKKNDGDRPAELIRRWVRNQRTINFLATWEEVHNPNFKVAQMNHFKNYASLNRNFISTKIYLEQTQAIGIIAKSGRYGGTYAHPDIALNFCYWLSPEFQVYLMKEFQRLKEEEALRLGDPFNIKRFLTSGNYSLLVSSVLSGVDERLLTHPQPYKKRLPFAAEADMINEIVFGHTASEWRRANTDKPTDRNQRDFASVLDLTILNNLEFLDAMLIQWDVLDKEERRKFLKESYDFQYPILARSQTLKKLQKLADKSLK